MSKCLIANISKEIMDGFNTEYSYIKNSDMNIELKDLVLETNLIQEELSFNQPLVFMFDYTEEEMNQISTYFKSHQINPILIASTSHNLLWTFKELYEEVLEEHEMFQVMDQLKKLIKLKMMKPIDHNKELVEKTLMESFIVLQEKNIHKMKEQVKKLQEI